MATEQIRKEWIDDGAWGKAGASVVSYQYVTITTQYTPPGWLTLGAKQAPSEYPDVCCDSTCAIPLGS